MNEYTLSPRGSNAANRLTPEQKLIRLRAAFLVHNRAKEIAQFRYLQYKQSNSMADMHRYDHYANRAYRAEQYIMRLTAPVEPSPVSTPQVLPLPILRTDAELAIWSDSDSNTLLYTAAEQWMQHGMRVPLFNAVVGVGIITRNWSLLGEFTLLDDVLQEAYRRRNAQHLTAPAGGAE